MVYNRPEPDHPEHSADVLPFRLRSRPGTRSFPGFDRQANDNLEPVDHLAQYEQHRDDEDEPIDYRHRMVMNVIAVVVVTFLVGAGVWIADTIAEMQRDQDCVMQGRQNCAPIEVPPLKP